MLSIIAYSRSNITIFYANHVTPYTLNELLHSALPWEYDVLYFPPTRRTISVSSTRGYNVFILPQTLTQATHPRVPL